MSEHVWTQNTALQRPMNDDKEAWKGYWEQQGQPWRTKPEIEEGRKKYLAERRCIKPDIEQGIYPFKDISLSRADVEWLLATHEDGRGPVNWINELEHERKGLDLRGADLCQIDLSLLPLARLRGGLAWDEHSNSTPQEQYDMAAVHLKRANLFGAHLEGVRLSNAHLEDANINYTHLERADLTKIHLEGANLEGAFLTEADLSEALLVGANLRGIRLAGGYITNATLGNEKSIGPHLVDIRWGDVNLAVINWSSIKVLGDEYEAQQLKDRDGKEKAGDRQINEHQTAVRANRQLAVTLQAQGLNEDAARFAYRAQKLQRVVWWRQKKFGQYIFSGFLDLLAGYGYRPGRSICWYLVTLIGFALAYSTFGHLSLWPPDAFVYSLTSFHGRGFFPGLEGKHSLHDPLIMFAAFEAIVGLFIEISFIATFTQRFFGK